ncbi:MAG: polyamine aminopropyltransferase [Candidatus Delongbacteria bacterium]|nr:polyamine aminopropyltransferase [Candidatus Delongbacteria bacterium]MBN2834622.1 polyamine aminopropyltransferase [Candidatus Delongbacteria bacterium]
MKLHKDTIALYFSMFIMGSCGIAYEYTFSKISSDLLGNSTKQWAVIIGLMMFFMGIGSDLQKYIKDDKLISSFIFYESLLALIGGAGPLLLLYIFGEMRDFYTLFQYLFIITTGTIIGMEIPLLSRINETYSKELRINLGGILKMDYIGSFAGALIWVFLLPIFFDIITSGLVLGSFNILVAFLTFFYFRKKITKSTNVFIFIVFVSIVNIILITNSTHWVFTAEQKLYKDKIILTSTTPYQHIVVTESSNGINNCYINGHLQFSSIDEHIYHEMLVYPALKYSLIKDNVLILGGGDGLAVREVLKFDKVKNVTLVDIDPFMTDLASQNKIFLALNDSSMTDSRVNIIQTNAISPGDKYTLYSPNWNSMNYSEDSTAVLHVINMDAFSYIEQVKGLFDVIIIDFPDPNSVELSKLYSVEFYARLKSKLSRNGVIVQQSTSPYHANEAFLCIGKTMEAVGFSTRPYHQNVPSFGEWGFWLGANSVEILQDFIVQADKLKEDKESKFFTDEIFKSSMIFGKGILDKNSVEVNTILNNVIFRYYDRAWRSL